MDSIWKNPLPPFYPDKRQPITEEEDREDARVFCETMGIADDHLYEELEPLDRLDEEDEWERECIRHELFD